jgi:hypothetical protein
MRKVLINAIYIGMAIVAISGFVCKYMGAM